MKAKIYIALPIFKHYEFQMKHSLDDMIMQAKNWEVGVYKEMWGESLISRARNNFAKEFLETDCTHLFFMDADIICYTLNAIDLMVADDLPIVAGAYVYKGYPLKPAFRLSPAFTYDLRVSLIILPAKYVSSGFMLIARRVLEEFKKEFKEGFYPFMPRVSEGEYLSEDWAFCSRVKETLNYHTFIDTRIDLGHLGLYPFKMSDYYRIYLDTNEAKSEVENAKDD